MKAVIMSAGQVGDYALVRAHVGAPDLVICADGGIRHALALGLTPALAVGDFDSSAPELVAAMVAQGVPIKRLPTEKDQTDTHVALIEALSRGATEIMLIGATGGRLDHTLANLLLLPHIPPAVTVTLVDDHNVIRVLRSGGRLTVASAAGQYLSLLPLSPEVKGVVVEGVKWPLDGETLRWGESRGVSNVITDSEAFVAVREGYLLVIQAWDETG
jgi:thiamine pyrophosphokinase